jgi:hypothetical protein
METTPGQKLPPEQQQQSFLEKLRGAIKERFEKDREREEVQLKEIGRGFGRDLLRVYESAGRSKDAADDSAFAIQSLIISLGEKVVRGEIKDPSLQQKIAQAVVTLGPIVRGVLEEVKPERPLVVKVEPPKGMK